MSIAGLGRCERSGTGVVATAADSCMSHLRRIMLLVLLVTVLSVVAAASASATTFVGRIDDPIDRSVQPSRDITRVVTRFDNATGRWTSSVTFAAAPSTSFPARLNLSLVPPKGQCPNGLTGLLLLIDIDGSSSSYNQSCRPPSMQPMARPAVTRSVSAEGRTLTYDLTDPSTIGLNPGELNTLRLSQRNDVFDFVPGTELYSVSAPATLDIGPATRFRVASDRDVVLPLTGVSRRARASMTLRTSSGATLARRSFTAKPGLPKLTVRLTSSGLRKVSRNGTRVIIRTSLTDVNGSTRRISQRLTLIR